MRGGNNLGQIFIVKSEASLKDINKLYEMESLLLGKD